MVFKVRKDHEDHVVLKAVHLDQQDCRDPKVLWDCVVMMVVEGN
jgi:hypothetical protein